MYRRMGPKELEEVIRKQIELRDAKLRKTQQDDTSGTAALPAQEANEGPDGEK